MTNRTHSDLDLLLRELDRTSGPIENDLVAIFDGILRFFSGLEDEFINVSSLSSEKFQALLLEVNEVIADIDLYGLSAEGGALGISQKLVRLLSKRRELIAPRLSVEMAASLRRHVAQHVEAMFLARRKKKARSKGIGTIVRGRA